METRKVEILENIKQGTSVLVEGSILPLEKELADIYIGAGLAKCAETGEVGERVAGASKVKLNNVVTKMDA